MSDMNRRTRGRFVKKSVAGRLKKLADSRAHKPPQVSLIPANEHSYAIPTHIHDEPDTQINETEYYVPCDLLPLSHCRFIVELDHLSDQLKACNSCSRHILLHKALGVRPYGVCGILYIPCECGEVKKIKLGKTHHTGKDRRGVGAFDVNTKAATGTFCTCT